MSQATNIDLAGNVKDAIENYASFVSEMLHSIALPTMLAPYKSDYRVVLADLGRPTLEVDVLVRHGVHQRLVFPFTACLEEVEKHVAIVKERLEEVLINLDDLLLQRELIETEACEQASASRRDGVGIRVTSVDLDPIHSGLTDQNGSVTIRYEAAACHMLRPFRDTLQASSAQETRDLFETLRADLGLRSRRLSEAEASGAVGFIDAGSLARLQEGSKDIRIDLGLISRSLQTQLRMVDHRAVSFEWMEGVVQCSDQPTSGSENASNVSPATKSGSKTHDARLIAFSANGDIVG